MLPYSYEVKCVIAGAAGTGKTALVRRLVSPHQKWEPGEPSKGLRVTRCIIPFHSSFVGNSATIEIDPKAEGREISIVDDSEAEAAGLENVCVCIWDLPGAHNFQQVYVATGFRAASIILFVYNPADRSTFTHVSQLMRTASAFAEESTVLALVAHSFDTYSAELNKGRRAITLDGVAAAGDPTSAVPREEALMFAQGEGAFFFQCNAKTGEGSREMITALVAEVLNRVQNGLIDLTRGVGGVQLCQPPQEKVQKKCCKCCCDGCC